MSADQDKAYRIRQLDDKSDYSLWRLRVRAAISAKGLKHVLKSTTDTVTESTFVEASSSTDTATDKKKDASTKVVSDDEKEQASNIIISALGDHALRVVRTVIGDPCEMMKKLDDRYDSKTTATRITKIVELMSNKFVSVDDDIARHIDRLAGLLEQLQGMGTKLDKTLQIGILVASIQVPELAPVTAAIKTLAEDDLKWDAVSSRLIEETHSLKSESVNRSSAAKAGNICELCHKPGHKIENCFLNPLNPNNKLTLPTDPVKNLPTSRKVNKGKRNSNGSGKKKNNTESERAAMAKTGTAEKLPDRMMLDSGTTAHMTNRTDRVEQRKRYETPITLADDSKVKSNSKGIRVVKWKTEHGNVKVSLSETLVAPDISTSLLSIPALAKKDIATLFLPGRAIMFDLMDNFKMIGQATQDRDGLYYITDFQDRDQEPLSNSEIEGVSAMRAFVERTATSNSTEETEIGTSDGEDDLDYTGDDESITQEDQESGGKKSTFNNNRSVITTMKQALLNIGTMKKRNCGTYVLVTQQTCQPSGKVSKTVSCRTQNVNIRTAKRVQKRNTVGSSRGH